MLKDVRLSVFILQAIVIVVTVAFVQVRGLHLVMHRTVRMGEHKLPYLLTYLLTYWTNRLYFCVNLTKCVYVCFF